VRTSPKGIKVEMEDICDWPTDMMISVQPDGDSWIAVVNLGVMYAFGLGGPKNYQAAGPWFLLAADHGDIRAQDNLGVLYQNGEGVRTDYIKAYMWFALAAAASGDSEAVKHRDQIAQLWRPLRLSRLKGSHLRKCMP
jgi:TPR repeat protein